FREGQGVVTEGMFTAGTNVFVADTVLAKHDETYMPKDVADRLKAQGLWKEGQGQEAQGQENSGKQAQGKQVQGQEV
ncbi:cytochrome c maturation protein CcmE, partial [Rhizobium ruizarguesonis]